MKTSFTDKVTSSVIEAHVAKHLAKLGGKMCRNEKLLKNVSEDIKKSDSSVQPLVIAADVTKDAERIISDAVKHFGILDVLINNAGFYKSDTLNNFNRTDR